MKILRLYTVLTYLCAVCAVAKGQQPNTRTQYTINDNWKFRPGGYEFSNLEKTNDDGWQHVALPHTWNASDPFDDDATYRRGICWYRKQLQITPAQLTKRVFLYFEGANQVSDVYINGAFVGQHRGGYTAFSFDVTSYLKPGVNLLAVQVNNAQDNFIPPLSVGYAMYGGIYRDVWLITTNKIHFNLTDHASSGVFISTPQVSASAATVKIRGNVVNDDSVSRKLEVVNYIYDPTHKLVATLRENLNLLPGKRAGFDITSDAIKQPDLWSPEHPALYSVVSRIMQDGKVIDEVTNPLGFRWFKFDPQTGFSLNGKKYILRGTNRHQDMKGKGSALSNEDHDRDLKLIKDMGCNFVRLAHYPQAPEVLRMADKLGLIIWEEIPVVNNMNIDPVFLENGKDMIREMIRQHYNHPSVMIWGSMNEVLLWSKGSVRIQEHTDTAYVNDVRRYAVKLDSTVRAEDPSRYSTMAMHWSDDYEKFKLSSITQISGWNIYNGWYSGDVGDFSTLLTKKHQEHPNEIILISEYGAESDNQVNTEDPQRLDFSGQYQRFYHESYLRQMRKLPFLAGTAIWNEFDFSQPNVGGTISHINHKGMISWDRVPKDVYYLYKANWNPEPIVYLATRDWLYRSGDKGTQSTIEAYSNADKVTLLVNGKSYGTKTPDDIKKLSWKVALQNGANDIDATAIVNGRQVTDHVKIYYRRQDPDNIADDLFVNVGANTQYTDEAKNIWVDDRPYRKGSFGYVGGTPSALSIKTLITYTDHTPLFYSYQNNISAYKADVADGEYDVELSFIEPDKCLKGDRVFNVSINKNEVLNQLDLVNEAGSAVALVKRFRVKAAGGKGITIDFKAIKGEPVLSGLKIKKL